MFDAGVESFRVFAHDDQIDARIARRNMRQVANGPEVREKLEALAQLDIDAREAAADGRSHRPLQPDARALDRFRELLGDVLVVLLKSFRASGEAFPFEFDSGGFKHANGRLDDFRANAVAGDESYFMSSHWIRRQLSH